MVQRAIGAEIEVIGARIEHEGGAGAQGEVVGTTSFTEEPVEAQLEHPREGGATLELATGIYPKPTGEGDSAFVRDVGRLDEWVGSLDPETDPVAVDVGLTVEGSWTDRNPRLVKPAGYQGSFQVNVSPQAQSAGAFVDYVDAFRQFRGDTLARDTRPDTELGTAALYAAHAQRYAAAIGQDAAHLFIARAPSLQADETGHSLAKSVIRQLAGVATTIYGRRLIPVDTADNEKNRFVALSRSDLGTLWKQVEMRIPETAEGEMVRNEARAFLLEDFGTALERELPEPVTKEVTVTEPIGDAERGKLMEQKEMAEAMLTQSPNSAFLADAVQNLKQTIDSGVVERTERVSDAAAVKGEVLAAIRSILAGTHVLIGPRQPDHPQRDKAAIITESKTTFVDPGPLAPAGVLEMRNPFIGMVPPGKWAAAAETMEKDIGGSGIEY